MDGFELFRTLLVAVAVVGGIALLVFGWNMMASRLLGGRSEDHELTATEGNHAGLDAQRRLAELQQELFALLALPEGPDPRHPGSSTEVVFDTPGWADESSRFVRAFRASQSACYQRFTELAPEPGSLQVSSQQLDALVSVLGELTENFLEIDRAIKLSDTVSDSNNTQFILDRRWGAPLRRDTVADNQPERLAENLMVYVARNWPVHQRIIRDDFTAAGLGQAEQKTLDSLLNRLVTHQLLARDHDGFIWPASTHQPDWGVFRQLSIEQLADPDAVPLIELANAAWAGLGTCEDQRATTNHLVVATAEQLGLTAEDLHASPQAEQRVWDALETGLATDRLATAGPDQIRRGRTQWPVLYRRPVTPRHSRS
ncbi:hypothetical protein [Auritidibacter sp. NML120636]|uniref:hypothetical protein n=1 Tax=Auritidibacter sp. NML120636 TaxID=2170743 RepID=UPI000D739465|nr:hypothetical protein [Auritidibacter sp. NML120636]PXA82106.1 hypothetical protein DCC25_01710 [Auritidibacter sp. NML120636]